MVTQDQQSEKEISDDFRSAMLEAFMHGRKHEPKHFLNDVEWEKIDEKHWPFSEWFRTYYPKPYNKSLQGTTNLGFWQRLRAVIQILVDGRVGNP